MMALGPVLKQPCEWRPRSSLVSITLEAVLYDLALSSYSVDLETFVWLHFIRLLPSTQPEIVPKSQSRPNPNPSSAGQAVHKAQKSQGRSTCGNTELGLAVIRSSANAGSKAQRILSEL
ncbi:hypothetical protein VTK56DRAFT_757 [Thermocarpiscus australiensis]